MRRLLNLAGFLLVVSLGTSGCDSNNNTIVGPTEVTFALADLAEILYARGVPIDIGDEEVVDYFPIPLRHFTVYDQDVRVFEFIGPNTALAVSTLISPDGTTINGRVIDWPATPHFFLSGRVIVLYLGDDPQAYLAIQDVMGPQFAGGEIDFTTQ
jgi:hypothetical protein